MPRYYFDVRDGTSIPDTEGTELSDLLAAQQQAVTLSGELLTAAGESPGLFSIPAALATRAGHSEC